MQACKCDIAMKIEQAALQLDYVLTELKVLLLDSLVPLVFSSMIVRNAHCEQSLACGCY